MSQPAMNDKRMGEDRPSDADLHQSDAQAKAFSLAEVARHLDVSTDGLQRLRRRFARHLSPNAAAADAPSFTTADIAALVTVQKLLAQGYDDEQIDAHLTPPQIEEIPDDIPGPLLPAEVNAVDDEEDSGLPQVVGDVLHTIVSSQQAVLNGQTNLRDMLNVVVQDNFNLKDENRKLRDRMLEMERVLAEYQRREETRKERMEGRLRALEATVAALQQQVSQLVQIQRQQQRRRGWFG